MQRTEPSSLHSLQTQRKPICARTAEIFGTKDRGTVQAGKFADLVVFDPATYADRASYEQPTLPPVGVRWVLVNGTVAVADGKAVPDVLAGRALRK